MLPIIHVKFRRRNGVPIAVEYLSGRQFRCRHCNSVYFTEKELDRHIKTIDSEKKKKQPVDPVCPQLSTLSEIRVLYTYDINDRLKKQWLKLRDDETYDGI